MDTPSAAMAHPLWAAIASKPFNEYLLYAPKFLKTKMIKIRLQMAKIYRKFIAY
jgi:hypothetical protein